MSNYARILFLLSIASLAVTAQGAAQKFASPEQISGFGQKIVTVLGRYDFDGDGHKDLLLADHATGNVTIELNTDGSGKNFGSATTLGFFPASLDCVAAGNLTHSGTAVGGLPDLAVASDAQITVEANQGIVSGTVAFTSTNTLSDPNYYFYHVAVADLTGDGYDDIVASAQPYDGSDGQLAVFINKGANGPGFYDPVYYDTGDSYVGDIAAGDLNGDGEPDVVLAGSSFTGAPNVALFTNQGAGIMGGVTQYPVTSNVTSVGIGNVTGHTDGRADVLATGMEFYRTSNSSPTYEDTTLEVLFNPGNDNFLTSPLFPAGLPVSLSGSPAVGPIGSAILNYNSNGTANVLVASPWDGGVTQLGFTAGTDSQGYFSSLKIDPKLVTRYATAPQTSQVTVADLNGDGRPDIISAVDPVPNAPALSDSTSATVLLNDATTAPSAQLNVSVTSNAVNGSAILGQDILYTIYYSNTGNAPAQAVTVGALVGPLATYVQGSASDGGMAAVVRGKTVLTWNIGAVPAPVPPATQTGGSVSFHMMVLPNAKVGKKLTGAVAIAEGSTPEDGDSLPLVIIENPLQLTLTASPASNPGGNTTTPGDMIDYTLNYQNLGTQAASNVVITTGIPSETSLADSNGQPIDSGATTLPLNASIPKSLQWTLPTLGGNSSVALTFEVIVSSRAKPRKHITSKAKLVSSEFPSVTAHSTPSLVVVAAP